MHFVSISPPFPPSTTIQWAFSSMRSLETIYLAPTPSQQQQQRNSHPPSPLRLTGTNYYHERESNSMHFLCAICVTTSFSCAPLEQTECNQFSLCASKVRHKSEILASSRSLWWKKCVSLLQRLIAIWMDKFLGVFKQLMSWNNFPIIAWLNEWMESVVFILVDKDVISKNLLKTAHNWKFRFYAISRFQV